MHLKWLETWVGVYALLKRDIPHLIKAHCVAHRLELAFSNSVKVLPPLEEAKDMLHRIWKHYHYSPKSVHELKELAESMQVKADGTHWVPPLKRALDILLLKNYYTVVTHLQHSSQARDASVTMQGRASNYCKRLVSYKVLLFLHLLPDTVTATSKLSLQLQDDKISISQLQDKVNTLSSTRSIQS